MRHFFESNQYINTWMTSFLNCVLKKWELYFQMTPCSGYIHAMYVVLTCQKTALVSWILIYNSLLQQSEDLKINILCGIFETQRGHFTYGACTHVWPILFYSLTLYNYFFFHLQQSYSQEHFHGLPVKKNPSDKFHRLTFFQILQRTYSFSKEGQYDMVKKYFCAIPLNLDVECSISFQSL